MWPSRSFPGQNGAFNLSWTPLVQRTKNVEETRGVSPRTQIKSIYRVEHIKQKLFKNPSKIILTISLKLIISAKKQDWKGKNSQQMQTKNTPLKFASSGLEFRFARFEHIKRKLVKYKHDLLKDFEEGGSSDRTSNNTPKP